MEFLDRQAAPLTTDEWSRLDEAVVSTARQILTGRRVVEVLGPLGSGAYSVPYSVFAGKSAAGIDLVGDKDDFIVEATRRDMATLPMLYKDFKLMWRDVEADRHLGLPLDVSTASVAANFVAVQEDNLIFNGSKELGHAGLMTVKGRQTITLTDWEQPGAALADVVKATGALSQAGHYGPYSLVVSPQLFGKMVRVLPNTGMLELDQVKALVSGGVFYSNVLSGAKAVLLATGSQNVSLAIGQDMVTAYLGQANMNHVFRVLETVALLVRRPEAICTLE